jgi:hypothetical protein
VRRLRALAALAGALVASGAGAEVAFTHQAIELPGIPAAIFAADLDRDGARDLAVVVAGARWGELGFSEPVALDESGAFADALTVVPALFERRQLVVHRGAPGRFAAEPLALELPVEVRAIDSGGAAAPLAAWTDDGLAEVALGSDGALGLVPRLAARSLLAGSVDLLPPLGLALDLDRDGARDFLLPTAAGLALHPARGGAIDPEPSQTIAVPLEERLPGDARHYRRGPVRRTPLPLARDLDGDGLPELLFRNHDRGWNEFRALPNLGGGRFGAPFDPLGGRARDAEPAVVFVGDLDGAPGAELLTEEELDGESDSLRAGLLQAKRPRYRYRVHRLDGARRMVPEPARTFELEGHLLSGAPERFSPLRDLDGDGRLDLVLLRFDFSLFEAARALAAKRVKLELELAVHCQGESADFRESARLAGELRLKLEALQLAQTHSLAGDFDGDGRADFLRLGPGRRAEIFRGRPGCRYPERPDAVVPLASEPPDASLVEIDDYDGDGRSDLALVRPRRGRDEAEVATTLDLYLSGGAR